MAYLEHDFGVHVGAVWGFCRGVLGSSSWSHLAGVSGRLGRVSEAHPGTPRVDLGSIWGRSGVDLGSVWGRSGASWALLQASSGIIRSRFFCKKSDPSEMGHFWWDFVGVKSAPVSVWGASMSNESPQEPPRGWFFLRPLTRQAPFWRHLVLLEAVFSARKVTHLRWVTFGGILWE